MCLVIFSGTFKSEWRVILWPRTEICFIQVIYSLSECVSTCLKRIEKKRLIFLYQVLE